MGNCRSMNKQSKYFSSPISKTHKSVQTDALPETTLPNQQTEDKPNLEQLFESTNKGYCIVLTYLHTPSFKEHLKQFINLKLRIEDLLQQTHFRLFIEIQSNNSK